MKSLNRAELIGNVGSEPEIRVTQNGSKVANFSLATNRTWVTAGGEKQEATSWHKCIVWNASQKGGLADIVEKYVKKGEKLFVAGRIEYRNWDDKDGVKRTSVEINVSELLILGGKEGTRPAVQTDAPVAQDEPSLLEDDDDLPF